MNAYNLLQVKFISRYAKHLGMEKEQAVKRWIEEGLAEKFAQLYRQHYLKLAEVRVPVHSKHHSHQLKH